MDNGNIIFSSEEKAYRLENRPSDVFSHHAVAYVVAALCFVIDLILFYQLLSRVVREAPLILIGTTAGLLFGFDLAPLYLGKAYRQKTQGINVNGVLMGLFLAAFLLALATNTYLRIQWRDLALPGTLSFGTSMLSTAENTSSEVNPNAMAFAVMSSILPVITSLTSFGIAYSVSDLFEDELKRLKKIERCHKDTLDKIDSLINEYDAIPNHFEDLFISDSEHFNAACLITLNKAFQCADIVRHQFVEELKDLEPADINAITNVDYENLIKLLSRSSDNSLSTLISNLTSKTYTISYNANGGVNAPASQMKKNCIPLYLSNIEPTRSGYTFQGWATNASASKAEYQAGSAYKTDAETTLHAVWKALDEKPQQYDSVASTAA